MAARRKRGWQAKDSWLAALLFAMGALVTAYAYLAIGKAVPFVLCGSAWLLGPALMLIGAYGMFCCLRSAWRGGLRG